MGCAYVYLSRARWLEQRCCVRSPRSSAATSVESLEADKRIVVYQALLPEVSEVQRRSVSAVIGGGCEYRGVLSFATILMYESESIRTSNTFSVMPLIGFASAQSSPIAVHLLVPFCRVGWTEAF